MGDFIPFEYPATADGEYTAVLNEGQIIMTRRLQLGLTQHQVAKMAGLHLHQYQRLEGNERFFSGCSIKTGMAVCCALLLAPMDIVHPCVLPANGSTLKLLPLFDNPDPHKVGRKQIRREIMRLTISHNQVTIPEDVVNTLGNPPYIRYLCEQGKRRILLSAAERADSLDVFAVPDDHALTIPDKGIVPESSQYYAKCRLVRDRRGAVFVLCDLATATKE